MGSKEQLIKQRKSKEEQLRQVYLTIEGVVPTYTDAMDTLERHIQPNMTPEGVEQWFDLFMRVMDLAVEIRRGEIRHRTERKFVYESCTKTCHANATTSGLGIDDGNALINDLDNIYRKLKKNKPMQLDMLESQLDILDRDTIGPLDKRITECKKRMETSKSAYYTVCNITVHGDLHVELHVRQGSTLLVQKKRACVDVASCECPIDAKPWEHFKIILSSKVPVPQATPTVAPIPDVNLNDLKKSFGVDVEERERNLEAFHNEMHDSGMIQSIDQQNSSYKRRCIVQPSSVILEKAGSSITQSIVASLKPTTTGLYHVHYGEVHWEDTPAYDKMKLLIDVCESSSYQIEAWTMHDISITAVEMTSFASVLSEKQSLRSLVNMNLRGLNVKPSTWSHLLTAIKTLPAMEHLDLSYNTLSAHGAALEVLLSQLSKLKSVNLEQCHLQAIESQVMAGLKALAGCGSLKRLSLADNSFTRSCLIDMFRMFSTMDLDTLNMRYVDVIENGVVDEFDFMELKVHHLHVDYSSLLQDRSFLNQLAIALSTESYLYSINISALSPPPDLEIKNLVGKISTNGQLRRLSLRGITCLTLKEYNNLFSSCLTHCSILEISVTSTIVEALLDNLLPGNVPALREFHLSIQKSVELTTDLPLDQWKATLERQLPQLTKIDLVKF